MNVHETPRELYYTYKRRAVYFAQRNQPRLRNEYIFFSAKCLFCMQRKHSFCLIDRTLRIYINFCKTGPRRSYPNRANS